MPAILPVFSFDFQLFKVLSSAFSYKHFPLKIHQDIQYFFFLSTLIFYYLTMAMNGDGYYCVGTTLIHFLNIVRPAVNLIGRKNSVIVRNNFVKSRSTSLESEQNADKAEQENLKKIENLRQFQQIFISPLSQFLKKNHNIGNF